MSLREYQRKRDFKRTREPKGNQAESSGWSFVVQKHQARHLHYDFRLELDGVLKSWAVPKGPSLDPAVKRLAMHVEDHPVEYGGFEGIIPQGEYGGGTVMLWDRGHWEPVGNPQEGYRKGRLKFRLRGEKLKGGWMLVRKGASRAGEEAAREWFLFKERDGEARSIKAGDLLTRMPLSVVSGRDLDEIAAASESVWKTKEPEKTKGTKSSTITKLPARIDVQLASLAKEVPSGDDWFHEIKFDGYRMLCRIEKGEAQFLSRNHLDWTSKLLSLAQTVRKLPVFQAILDGEVVALRPDGTTDFQDLQNAFRRKHGEELHYYVFDLLFLNGKDMRPLPLEERKQQLAKILLEKNISHQVHFSEHLEGHGEEFFAQACQKKLEGIISKHRDRPYRPGRSYDWLKTKCVQKDEFVIGGYTRPSGSRQGFGAILVGYHNADGELQYAGKVGTGFDDRTLSGLQKRFETLRREKSPFQNLKRGGPQTFWLEPTLVGQVGFGQWTRGGHLRHASFQGLREDKPAKEITREKAIPLSQIPAPANGKQQKRRPTRSHQEEYDSRKQTYRNVRFTSPEKILYPDQNITKLDLARYYFDNSPWILPHLIQRPVVLVRCPEGQPEDCFYQKHPALGTPANLRQVPIRETKSVKNYVMVDDAQGLISLAQIGALEIHAWGSREGNLEKPDRLIFDLDPDPTVSWEQVIASARQVRQFLQALGLESFVKTTGGKGLHLVVPVEATHDWKQAKAFCKQVAALIVAADPNRYTANMAKAARVGKIYLDYLRNGRGATAIIPYSPRARSGAPVSVPLSWRELNDRVRSDQYTIKNLSKRLSSLKRDPWEEMESWKQSLKGPLEHIKELEHKIR